MHEGRKGAGGEAGTVQASGDLTYAGALLCVLGARDAALRATQSPRIHGEDPQKASSRSPIQRDIWGAELTDGDVLCIEETKGVHGQKPMRRSLQMTENRSSDLPCGSII